MKRLELQFSYTLAYVGAAAREAMNLRKLMLLHPPGPDRVPACQ